MRTRRQFPNGEQDGYLDFTANQFHCQKNYQGGRDLREKPYTLFRVKIDGGPVLLRREK